MRADAKGESLSIPASVRAQVDARDLKHCRVCGRFLGDRRAMHHVIYGGDARGMGGRRVHHLSEIVTICWLPGDGDCHGLVHADKHRWQAVLLEVARRPGVTALQVQRWQAKRTERPAPQPMQNSHHQSGDRT